MPRIECTFPLCERPVNGHGLCSSHYAQRYRYGIEPRRIITDVPIEERFWDCVAVRSNSECWLWTKTIHKKGHGIFSFGGKNLIAHRISYELTHGEIDAKMQIDHQCRNRSCVNPSHLKQVTNKENQENLAIRKDNASGYRGVTQRSNGLWRARVGHNGKILHIGDFDTPDTANEAVIAARLKLYTNNVLDRGGV